MTPNPHRYVRVPATDKDQSAVPVNGTATPTTAEVHDLAHAADYALSAVAWLNNTGFKDRATRAGVLGEDLARQLEAAQVKLYDKTRAFRDRAGRIADGLHVVGPPTLGALDRSETALHPTGDCREDMADAARLLAHEGDESADDLSAMMEQTRDFLFAAMDRQPVMESLRASFRAYDTQRLAALRLDPNRREGRQAHGKAHDAMRRFLADARQALGR